MFSPTSSSFASTKASDCKSGIKTMAARNGTILTRKNASKRTVKPHSTLKRVSGAIASTSSSTSRNYSIAGKTPQQVQRRNERERRRVQAVNHGYEILAQQLADWDELKDKKLTKAQTLKAAILYIRHMQKLLSVPASCDADSVAELKAEIFADYDFSDVDFEELGVVEPSTSAKQTDKSCESPDVKDGITSHQAYNSSLSCNSSHCAIYPMASRTLNATYEEKVSPSLYTNTGAHNYTEPSTSSVNDSFPVENAALSSPQYTNYATTGTSCSWPNFQQHRPQYLYSSDNQLALGYDHYAAVVSPAYNAPSTTINDAASRSYTSPCFLPNAAPVVHPRNYHSV